ncbi:MAG TPA: alpha-amylase [Polyangiaceae bacterium]
MSLQKGVMFQFFEWNLPADGALWSRIAESAAELHAQGMTAVWFPPPNKGQAGGMDVGYGAYDLYDLGEFDQKGSVRTKYGTRDELLRAIDAVQSHGMDAYLDCVMNHRIGGDETEEVTVVEVDQENRFEQKSDPYVIKAWSRYTFAGRAGKHSPFVWTKDQFNAFGADANQPGVSGKIFRVADRQFSTEVDHEKGTFDYLMGANVDHTRQEVKDELVTWGAWLLETTKARGVRIDAAKHISHSFAKEWLARVRETKPGQEIFAVGEYWSASVDALEAYLAATEGAMRLFDVPLHFRFHEAGERGRDFDLRTVFDGTLVQKNPLVAVTFVDNHDSQPGQALQSPIADWFKPIAYALILLRSEGYPCVFHGDYFGNEGEGEQKLVAHKTVIDRMLAARAKFLYGNEESYLESPNAIGWLATGEEEHPGVMAVAISTADATAIKMQTHRPGLEFEDVTRAHEHRVKAGEDGVCEFPAPAGSVSVWCSV